ncbi:MAG TPA: MFS transporter [Jiangellaceae bacterium]
MVTTVLSRPRPSNAKTPDGFYGWRIVAYASLAVAATGPGQTAGVSLFVDPLIRDLGISRSAVSTAYLIGTLTGALALPWIGRALDRYGVRRTMAVIGAAFGAVLIALATVSSIVGLTAGFVGIRMAGQGALTLTATTAAALWFDRRRGTAVGIVSAVGAVGISMTPLLAEMLIAQYDWRVAWLILGLAVWLVVIPIALAGMRDRPASLGQWPDGSVPSDTAAARAAANWGVRRGEAMRHPFFWVVTGGVAACGLLGTAVNFHQISLLGERGLSTAQAAANFIPQTVAALAATLATGMLADRVRHRWLIIAAMASLAGGLAWATQVTPGLSAVLFGALIGAAGGSMRALEAATFPRYFGTRHIGSIRGTVAALSVASTAFGPLLYAAAHSATGGYTAVLWASLPLPLLIAAVAVFVHPPRLREHHR